MAYIRLSELAVEPVSQRHTPLGTEPDGTRRFRYETLGSTGHRSQKGTPTGRGVSGYHSQDVQFSAELLVDAEGLVIEYPPYWRRMAAAQALMAAGS